jgi:hypothetical protein
VQAVSHTTMVTEQVHVLLQSDASLRTADALSRLRHQLLAAAAMRAQGTPPSESPSGQLPPLARDSPVTTPGTQGSSSQGAADRDAVFVQRAAWCHALCRYGEGVHCGTITNLCRLLSETLAQCAYSDRCAPLLACVSWPVRD